MPHTHSPCSANCASSFSASQGSGTNGAGFGLGVSFLWIEYPLAFYRRVNHYILEHQSSIVSGSRVIYVLKTLKHHIGMGLDQNDTKGKSLTIQIRIAEIRAEFNKMLKAISADTVEAFDEAKATEMMNEKSRLEQ